METKNRFLSLDEINMLRCRFVKGMAVGGALIGLGLFPARLLATGDNSSGQQTLCGKHFNLTLAPQPGNFTGSEHFAIAVNGSVPGPVLRRREDDLVTFSSLRWRHI